MHFPVALLFVVMSLLFTRVRAGMAAAALAPLTLGTGAAGEGSRTRPLPPDPSLP